MREIDKAIMKERFHEAFHKASEAGVVKTGTDFGSTYTFAMLRALKDMADHEVWPDGRFGDDDCNVWSLFHRYNKVDVEKGIKELREENAELFADLGKAHRKYTNCAYEKGKLQRELDAQRQANEALKAEVERLKHNLSVLSSAEDLFNMLVQPDFDPTHGLEYLGF